MVYIFIDFEDCKYWIEVNEDGFALRQVISENGKISVSCRDDCLAEGVFDTINDGEIIITQLDFEKMWKQATQLFREQWIIEKQKYTIGSKVSGKIKYLYPQGVVFDLENVQGCANVLGYVGVYPNCLITGIVTAYDDVNMWVLIDGCTVEPEPVRSITIVREKCRVIGSLIKYYCIFNLNKVEFEEFIIEINKSKDKGNQEIIASVMECWDVVPISNGKTVSIKAAIRETLLFVVAFTSTGTVLSNQITISEGEFDLSYNIKTNYDIFKGTTLLISGE